MEILIAYEQNFMQYHYSGGITRLYPNIYNKLTPLILKRKRRVRKKKKLKSHVYESNFNFYKSQLPFLRSDNKNRFIINTADP